MIIINALQKALDEKGIISIVVPQISAVSDAHLEVALQSITAGGEKKNGNAHSYETITLSCDVVSLGVTAEYVKELSKILRVMAELTRDSLLLAVPQAGGSSYTIKAHFEKLQDGRFEAADGEVAMPVEYREPYRVTITYPTSIIL